MMRLRLFTLPKCPKCPAAKELVNLIQKERSDLTVEILDMSQPENMTTALMLQIASTPSFAIDDTAIFIGDVPSLDELNRKLDEYKSRMEP